jgi:hypothetical protein
MKENECHKCGAAVAAGEPFCGRCGAVVGMHDAAPKTSDTSADFARTVVGKARKGAPRRTAPAPPRQAAGRTAVERAAGGSNARYAAIGFVVVLLVGGLLLLWLWTNSNG